MAPLRSGPYTLRILQSNDSKLLVGGEYATARGPQDVVYLAREGIRGQVWDVTVEGEDERGYLISLRARGINDDSLTYLHNKINEPGAPLILSEEKLFEARRENDIEGIGIFSLVPTDIKLVGATWYVGRNDREEVALQPIPVIPDAPPHPVWAFIPADRY
ncbi:hypothetical protein RSOLAG22IIIB_11877 [Rhizoctonia solani]|uniref:Ricin B lectin domain-containing protein n=1 Tax=Rhizoctonia solani TaxID=456999 RepID=A0A0K6GAH7_9AGAM|nr:hypothetical protein RSOLAG22IIIB_11877 [Rhizoctonia solani]